jgi:hypothetical protein
MVDPFFKLSGGVELTTTQNKLYERILKAKAGKRTFYMFGNLRTMEDNNDCKVLIKKELIHIVLRKHGSALIPGMFKHPIRIMKEEL